MRMTPENTLAICVDYQEKLAKGISEGIIRYLESMK